MRRRVYLPPARSRPPTSPPQNLPSYVSDPDVTRVTWINTVTELLWPHIDAAATAFLVEVRGR